MTKDEVVKMAGEPVAYIPFERGGEYHFSNHINASRIPLEGWMPVYTAPPQPAAQEPTSAVPVVEQLVEALDALCYEISCHNSSAYCQLDTFETTDADAAIAAGQKFIKENGK